VLIRDMSRANPTWGAPRIIGELRKLGIHVAKSTVEKYRVYHRQPPSPTWQAFLNNHMKDLVALDFFTVPTVTYKVLFVLVILAHERRWIVHVNVTEHPTAAWTAQQVVDAFPWVPHSGICCAIGIASMLTRSGNAYTIWGSKKC
jgi:putative transposase